MPRWLAALAIYLAIVAAFVVLGLLVIPPLVAQASSLWLTLPNEFNLGAGHQVLVGQGVPLSPFAPGAYKLEIKITDKTDNKSITRDVPFSVLP